jgi:hypothetical protein
LVEGNCDEVWLSNRGESRWSIVLCYKKKEVVVMVYGLGVLLEEKKEITAWSREIEKEAGLVLAYLVDKFELSYMDNEKVKKLTKDDFERLFDRYLESALDKALDHFLDKVGAYKVLIYLDNEWVDIWRPDELLEFADYENIYEIAYKALQEQIKHLV